ncbi:MAG: four helix bundle protein [Verrucomicrobiae bacterium]|nr:four helix bundle protein [Verrucomicrobiae bacterium]
METATSAKTFEDLQVWQKAHAFVLAVYKLTSSFPKEEIYGLTAQFRRAAVSVPANIAEGFVKRGSADKLRFYNIAQGSLEECRYYSILAGDLGLSSTELVEDQISEISRMLNVYISKIKQ